jgi:hypothetical protein
MPDLKPSTTVPDPAAHLPPHRGSALAAPAGLTAADLTRIAAAAGAARAASTHKLYRHTWDRWVRWCATRDLDPLPAARQPSAPT